MQEGTCSSFILRGKPSCEACWAENCSMNTAICSSLSLSTYCVTPGRFSLAVCGILPSELELVFGFIRCKRSHHKHSYSTILQKNTEEDNVLGLSESRWMCVFLVFEWNKREGSRVSFWACIWMNSTNLLLTTSSIFIKIWYLDVKLQ